MALTLQARVKAKDNVTKRTDAHIALSLQVKLITCFMLEKQC